MQLYFKGEQENVLEEIKKEQDESFISKGAYRPIKNFNAAEWWKFAITCVLKDLR